MQNCDELYVCSQWCGEATWILKFASDELRVLTKLTTAMRDFFFFHNGYHSHYHGRLIQQLTGLHMVLFLKWNLLSYVTVNVLLILHWIVVYYTNNWSQSCIYVWICNSKQNLITNKAEMKMKIFISNLYIFEKIHRIIEHKTN